MEICAQTTEQKHKHSSPWQRLSPNWRQDQRRLCSSQTCTTITRIRKFRRLHLTKFNKTFTSLTPRTTAVLQWIHAHTGIHGNEVADQLGKDWSKKQQPKSKVSYQEGNTLIRNKRLADFKYRKKAIITNTNKTPFAYYRATNIPWYYG